MADKSHSKLTEIVNGDRTVISPNALGVKLEDEKLIAALEQTVFSTSDLLGSRVFKKDTNLLPIYYDWTFIVKQGNCWELCKELPDGHHGIKIGMAYDNESKSVVSLTMHGTDHPADVKAFENHLMVKERVGIIHIPDMGPYSAATLQTIDSLGQYFIIRKRQDIEPILVYQTFAGRKNYQLEEIASKPHIVLLSDSVVTVQTKDVTLSNVREIVFQRHDKEGKFETIVLLSNLHHDALTIIELSASRWACTETIFRMLKHEFGLNKLYVKKSEKAWALLLVTIISVQLLEIAFQAIHYLHGGKLTPKEFRMGFYRFLSNFPNQEAYQYLTPCSSPTCPYRRKHGQRWR